MKLILFDVDGTLIDSQQMICAAMQRAFDSHGLVCPPAPKVLSIVGLSLEEAITKLCEGTDHPVASLAERYKQAFFELRAGGKEASPFYPGARETIAALRQRDDVLLGIATGKSVRGVQAMFDQHDLHGVFATIQTADTAPSKPHPDMVLQAMRETGIGPDDTVLIGDTVYDITMARAAGSTGIGVSWGYHPVADLHAAGAHTVLDTFDALDPALATLWPDVVEVG